MKKNGYTLPEIIIVITIFGVIYFLAANNLSYAFNVDYESDLYKQTIESIEKNAVIYGENNLDLFVAGNEIYITVDELAQKGLAITSSDGKVVDPRDKSKNLNDVKVKITYENNQVIAKIVG